MISSPFITNLLESCDTLKQTSLSPHIENDVTYQQDLKDCAALESRLEQLAIGSEQRMVINDYISSKNSLTDQYSNLSYLGGFYNCLQLLTLFQNAQQNRTDISCTEPTKADD